MKNPNRPVIAIDIGGTKIMTALFDAAGKLIGRDVFPTLAANGFEDVIERIAQNVQGLLQRNSLEPAQVGAITIAAAGGIDTGRGVVVTPSPHLPDWKEVPLAAMFKSRFGVDTYVLNDASAAALGEHRYGIGRGVKHLVLLTLGTGIGGGIIIDGELYLGAAGGAGELGHMTIEAHGPRCGCGNTGCLEMLVSGSAIERNTIEHLHNGEASTLVDKVKTGNNIVSVPDIVAAARSGDKLAQDVMARAAFYLGVGFVNIINIFNPELIVYGGGMAELGDILVGPGKKMALEIPFSLNARAVRIVQAQLGNEAGIYGAAAFGRDMHLRRTR
ncbi:MAG: ROK family protein [Burkholderiales bacterium]|nr:MAG: ROK family protein [Burkholderiales bacterium]